ncbi:hypothetical protein EJ08DRAFT_724344 [Tothia fuscella]|uniref:Uncharacterized protein n=1 Tax=Tothia fuscella TaxID=1048955 RepID=A0A9P4NYS1_9PEZI|nr:hypothetical protein EJ08DRAFT_724344 [Tothia fuscella]
MSQRKRDQQQVEGGPAKKQKTEAGQGTSPSDATEQPSHNLATTIAPQSSEHSGRANQPPKTEQPLPLTDGARPKQAPRLDAEGAPLLIPNMGHTRALHNTIDLTGEELLADLADTRPNVQPLFRPLGVPPAPITNTLAPLRSHLVKFQDAYKIRMEQAVELLQCIDGELVEQQAKMDAVQALNIKNQSTIRILTKHHWALSRKFEGAQREH